MTAPVHRDMSNASGESVAEAMHDWMDDAIKALIVDGTASKSELAVNLRGGTIRVTVEVFHD